MSLWMCQQRAVIGQSEEDRAVYGQRTYVCNLKRFLNIALLIAAVAAAQPKELKSVAAVGSILSDACPAADQSCIIAKCDQLWIDPESALWIVTYLAADNRSFVDEYLKLRYKHERDGNVKIVLLSKLMDRNKVPNLPFIIDRLREFLRVGKEGDRPGLLALRYLQHKVLLEYDCDDRKFPRDRGYRNWVSGLYLKWYERTAGDGIDYKPTVGVFVAPGDNLDNAEAHLSWASGCRAETYRESWK
jgi:hypothetical protein